MTKWAGSSDVYVLIRSDYALISARRYAAWYMVSRAPWLRWSNARRLVPRCWYVSRLWYTSNGNSLIDSAVKKATIGRKGNPWSTTVVVVSDGGRVDVALPREKADVNASRELVLIPV